MVTVAVQHFGKLGINLNICDKYYLTSQLQVTKRQVTQDCMKNFTYIYDCSLIVDKLLTATGYK